MKLYQFIKIYKTTPRFSDRKDVKYIFTSISCHCNNQQKIIGEKNDTN